MKNPVTRRIFLKKSAGIGLLSAGFPLSAFSNITENALKLEEAPIIAKGEKQIFVDDNMIAFKSGIERKSHAANKLSEPVLVGDESWEIVEWNGLKYPSVNIYGTVLHDETTGLFKMWYNVHKKTCYAQSVDGINWHKPKLEQAGATNMINLFDFHSPSIVLDKMETDLSKRYKAVGSKAGFSDIKIRELKSRFKSPDWYTRNHAYCAAYSADGIKWNIYPDPILLGMDTVTMAQNPLNSKYLAFHKNTQDPRSFGRQIFLSTSENMQSWSYPILAMATDEIDHKEARKLEEGTHAEFYNMSAFYYANQWLGLVTLFRCVGEPLKDGKARAGQKGIIDVRLVHSRDGIKWHRCNDRSPVIPVGPYDYDKGIIFGVCNTPVVVDDEMWVYYSASTDIHSSTNPDKENSIARASWRIDGLVSVQSGESEGLIETVPLMPDGNKLHVNVNAIKGKLLVEVVDLNRKVIPGYERSKCNVIKSDSIKQLVRWDDSEKLPEGEPICLRFILTNGDLFSYLIE